MMKLISNLSQSKIKNQTMVHLILKCIGYETVILIRGLFPNETDHVCAICITSHG